MDTCYSHLLSSLAVSHCSPFTGLHFPLPVAVRATSAPEHLCGAVETHPNQFTAVLHLPSPVGGFLPVVDFKLLARPLVLMFAVCLLCICLPLPLAEHPQWALFLPSFMLGFKVIALSFILSSAVWCVFSSVSFSEVSVPRPPLPRIPMACPAQPCLEWLMTLLKESASWFGIKTILFTKQNTPVFCVFL